MPSGLALLSETSDAGASAPEAESSAGIEAHFVAAVVKTLSPKSAVNHEAPQVAGAEPRVAGWGSTGARFGRWEAWTTHPG
jgi:hypothetical protein